MTPDTSSTATAPISKDAGPPRSSRTHEDSSKRVRRPSDLLLGLLAFAVVLAVIGLISALPLGSNELSSDVSHWLVHIPHGLSDAGEVLGGLGALTLVIVAFIVLSTFDFRGARNASIAGALGAGFTIIVSGFWHTGHGGVAQAVLHGKNPTTFVVDTAFVAFVVATDLFRRTRWTRWCSLTCGILLLSGLAVNELTPFAFVVSLSTAMFVGWTTRWLLGSISVQTSTRDLSAHLVERNIAVAHLNSEDKKRGSRLKGTLASGQKIEVRTASRDTMGVGLAHRLWTYARLHSSAGGHIALSSRLRLEQLALSADRASSADILVPHVMLLAEIPPETLVLVLESPEGRKLTKDADLEDASSLFSALKALHDVGVAHRDLQAHNLLIGEERSGFSSLDAAVSGAGELVRRLDVTQLLTTLGRMLGAPTAVAALRRAYQPVDEMAIATILQPIALAPWGWSAMREARGCVSEVRHELLGADATAPITRLERFRWRTVTTVFVLTFVAFLFIGQLSKVNLLGALREANYGWFAVAILGSALTYFAAAQNLAAFVPKRLSPLRGFFVQLATAFVGVAMPPTIGHVAVNARYLTRQKVDDSSIAAAIALSQIINIATTIPMLIIFGLLTGSGISRFKIVPGTDVLLGIAAIALVGAVLLAIPQTRGKFNRAVWPHLRSVWPRLIDAISQPLRLLTGVGANLLLTFGYLVAFIAALRSVGAQPALLAAAVVYLAGNAVGSAAPTPGGLGAVEAVLTAGLTAIGIPAHQAIPAVLIFRIATFWLPIPAGWISYLALQKRGTL